MTTTIQCPSCNQTLWIKPNSPTRVQCPKCLRLIVNPSAKIPPVSQPRHVLPVGEETERDLADSAAFLHVLWIALVITGLAGVLMGAMRFFGLGLILAGVIIAILSGLMVSKAPPMADFEAASEPPPSSDGEVVLDYAHHRQRRLVVYQESFRLSAFISGFFSSIALVTLVVLGLMHSKSREEVMFILGATAVAILGLAYVALRLGKEPRFNGIGRGIAMGFVFAFLAPFGICFLMVTTK